MRGVAKGGGWDWSKVWAVEGFRVDQGLSSERLSLLLEYPRQRPGRCAERLYIHCNWEKIGSATDSTTLKESKNPIDRWT